MRVKEVSETFSLKLNIKLRSMASGPITSWQIDGETMGTVTDFFLGSKIRAGSDCSRESTRGFLAGKR